jgi:predicted CoA-binding protein
VIGYEKVLQSVHTVLVVDWPSRDVPDTLARSGFQVTVHGGPGPEDYSVYEFDGGEVVVRHVGVAPGHVDLVYLHRPMAELPGIIAMAQALHAKAIWLQSGLTSAGTKDHTGCWVLQEDSRIARELAEAAGMAYLDKPYIADAVRLMSGRG